MSQTSDERRVGKDSYSELLSTVVHVIEEARLGAVKSVNTFLTAAYWLIGQRIVEHEQKGAERAEYGQALLKQLSRDLTRRLGRGFSERNLEQMRLFYLTWQNPQTPSANSSAEAISQTLSAKSNGWPQFALPWSHYVRLLTVSNGQARDFYEQEALRGGWSVRQLDRQIATRAFERTVRPRKVNPEDASSDPNEYVRDPFVLEFLNLKDEYSESDLENALVQSLEAFLLELGNDFSFVARQKKLRIGNAWYRVDLVFFHRLLRCLVIVDLKLGSFTHADAGQMNLYLNYAREHWTHSHENPPIGLILCSEKDAAVAHYALGNLTNQVLTREYEVALPKEADLVAKIEVTRRLLLARTNDEKA